MEYTIIHDCESRAEVFQKAHDAEGFEHEMQLKEGIATLLSRISEYRVRANRAELALSEIREARNNHRPSYVVDSILEKFYNYKEE